MKPGGSLPHSQEPTPSSVLSQINPVHVSSQLLTIHFSITPPPTRWSSQWSPFFRFPHQSPAFTSPVSYTRYMPRLSHSSWFDHSNDIWWGVQIMKLFIMHFSSLPSYLFPLRSKYFPRHPVLAQPHPTFLPDIKDQIGHPFKQESQLYCILKSLCLWTEDWKTKDSAPNYSRHSQR
jgi:hypothetical protein